jgi:hypothetical protein
VAAQYIMAKENTVEQSCSLHGSREGSRERKRARIPTCSSNACLYGCNFLPLDHL